MTTIETEDEPPRRSGAGDGTLVRARVDPPSPPTADDGSEEAAPGAWPPPAGDPDRVGADTGSPGEGGSEEWTFPGATPGPHWPGWSGAAGPVPPPPPAPSGGPETPRALLTVILICAVIIASVGVVLGHYLWAAPSVFPTLPSTAAPSTHPSTAPGAPANAAALAKKTNPALVDIDTILGYQALEGAGTGMVLTPNGEVLTNNHVIEGATSISVTDLGNGTTYGAVVVGYDRSDDVAVLQLTGASDLRTAALGDSSTLATGQGVVAVGNAYGVGATTSWAAGKVTALDQSITAVDEATGASERLSGLIATNADIVPGDSGGALVDAAGRVIGMTTAASENFEFSPSATEGYAIPVNAAVAVAAEIEAGQSSATVHVGPTPFLGVDVQSPPSGAPGAQIVEVVIGGPAARARLSAGDTIVAVDGRSVSSPEALTTLLLASRPGATVSVRYVNLSGQTSTVAVRLGSGPPQ